MQIGIRNGEASPNGTLDIILNITPEEELRTYELLSNNDKRRLHELQTEIGENDCTPEERATGCMKILQILLKGIILMDANNEARVVEIMKK